MLPNPTRHLQLQYQQIADASNPDQASTNPIPANCRCFQPQDMYLQIQYQQIADASEPRIGICISNTSKLQILPPPTRHLQIHIQQVADASNPDQASTSPIPANCRYFRPRPGICKFISSKLQILPHPEFTPICICKSNTSKLQMLPTLTRHLQLQFQQIADTSNPDQASASPIPASCRYFHIRNSPLYVSANTNPASCGCFQPRPGICKFNISKLQMLPTLTRHLQLQY